MKKFGMALILVGVLLVTGALGITIYNVADSNRAGRATQELLGPVAEAISERKEEPLDLVHPEGGVVPEMPVFEKNGLRYVGVIEIPSLSLSLPVLENWSYELLKISPCRYAGSCYTNDLVICAHNYEKHFNDLRTVDMGVDVYFTTVDGVTYHYVIVNRETLQPEENDRMITTDGDWDLTLFTCYIGGATRCTLRCKLAND